MLPHLNFHFRKLRFEFQAPFDAIQPPKDRVSYEIDLPPSCYRSRTLLCDFHHIFKVCDPILFDKVDQPPYIIFIIEKQSLSCLGYSIHRYEILQESRFVNRDMLIKNI
jgi:hypothetical protein